jgi:hypothetical protein
MYESAAGCEYLARTNNLAYFEKKFCVTELKKGFLFLWKPRQLFQTICFNDNDIAFWH